MTSQLECPRQHDAADQLFDRPTIGHELMSQMIEQLRMRRQFADMSEVIDRPHDARLQTDDATRDSPSRGR